MKKFLLFAVAFLIAACEPNPSTVTAEKAASVYDRVMETQTLRAAYITYPPALMRDTETGEITGIFAEVLQKAADNIGLELIWTEEVGWGAQIEGLELDRYDIVGSPVWANPIRGTLTTLSDPVYYSGIGVWVRADDPRATNPDLSWINSPEVRIATVDGETGDLIARTVFPDAQRVSLPQLASISQKFLEVTSNKADVLFAEPYFALQFLESNPDSVVNAAAAAPIKVLGNVFMMKKNEGQMRQMIGVAVEDLLNSGFVDEVLDRYEPEPNTFYRVARPYRIVE